MAKKSLILSDDNGKALLSNTSSIYYDDATLTISSSTVSASNITLSSLSTNSVLLLTASNGVIGSMPNATVNNSPIIWDGVKWTTTNAVLTYYSGNVGGDISGSADDEIKILSIANVTAGFLGANNGGTGANLSTGSNGNDKLLIASSSGGNVTFRTLTSSVNISSPFTPEVVTILDNKFTKLPPYYPDVRFYTSGSSGDTFTWIRPPNAKFARIILQGGGGGGGGSRGGTTLLNGSGGGAGAFTDVTIDLKNFTEASVRVGLGGLGGTNIMNATPTSGVAGSASVFTLGSRSYFAYGGSFGLSGTSNSGRAGGAGGTAMSNIEGMGYSRAGGAGASNGAAASIVNYGCCGGGYAGGWGGSITVVPMISSTNFGYFFTVDEKNISNLNFYAPNSIDDVRVNATASYGVGGSSTSASTISVNGTSACRGGHGYIIVISW